MPESLTAPPVAYSVAAEPAASTASAAGGNEQPRTLVCSKWVSEEVHIDALTEYDEAPENHRAIRLVNIVRTEPESGLFQIPSGYAVVDSLSVPLNDRSLS